MMKRLISVRCLAVVSLLTFSPLVNAQVKILFDATKGEMAGNADWVIDYDQTNLGVGSSGTYTTSSGHQSNPQQIPTPSQSGVTASTPETYWSGALSSWGIDCAIKGYTVETLSWNGQITYGSTSNAQDLSNYRVYVIDEPNIKFTDAEKTAILQFVQHGGSLYMISDHNNSDRNGDGWDSPHIWNDLMSTNSVVANPFGISFDLNDFSGSSSTIYAAATDSIINGPMGSVSQVLWSGGTSMTLTPTVNPTVKGVVFKSGSSNGNSNVLVAYSRFGKGKVAAMGDSSPTDDGTGNPNCSLYNGYWNDASGNHRKLIMNATIWLATVDTPATSHPSGIGSIGSEAVQINVFPNPSSGTVNIVSPAELSDAKIEIYTTAGQLIEQLDYAFVNKNEAVSLQLPKGLYFIRIQSDKGIQTSKIAVF